MLASAGVLSRAARVEFGQCFQEKRSESYGDPPASLHELTTTRGQEKLLGRSPQLSRCKVGIFVFF